MNVDGKLTRKIFENLLSNAIKFSQFDKQIELLFEQDKDKIQVGVKGQRPGIAPEEQENLFKKFQKLSSEPTAQESSTGLGLSIVKKYAEAMYGTIWCESKSRHGSTFWVEFPKA